MKNKLGMIEDYFETIDTKEKAYWLGLLYSDGYIETRDKKPYRLGIEVNKKEEILINRFILAIDLDPSYKKYREAYNTVQVRFVNKKMVNDLVKLGLIPKKSKLIELPELLSRELDLAFLLGVFDGDGKAGTTRIISGSKKFLEQIKKKFKLKSKIYEKNSSGYWRGRLIVSHGYSMNLGVKFLFLD